MSLTQFKDAITQGDLPEAFFYARLHVKSGGNPWPEYEKLKACFVALEEIGGLFEHRLLVSCLQRLEHIEKTVKEQGFGAIFGKLGPFSDSSFIAAKEKYVRAKQVLSASGSIPDVEHALELLNAETIWGAELWILLSDLRRKRWELILTSLFDDLSNFEANARVEWARGTIGPALNVLEDTVNKAKDTLKQAQECLSDLQEILGTKEEHGPQGWIADQTGAQEKFQRFFNTTETEIEKKENLVKEMRLCQVLGCFDAAYKYLMDCVKSFDDRKHDVTSISKVRVQILAAIEAVETIKKSVDMHSETLLLARDRRIKKAFKEYHECISTLGRTVFDYYTADKMLHYWKLRKKALESCENSRYKSALDKLDNAINLLGRTYLKRTPSIETEIAWALERLDHFEKEYGDRKNQVETAFATKVPAKGARESLDNLISCVYHITEDFNSPYYMATTLEETGSLRPFDDSRETKINKDINDMESVYNTL